ncbi:lipopolysaccharide biosynthesis protein [Donghicola eburneus]|uniref:lipopolysaccharide biosynthesis protein n=1 Tax=Donghicola eburneus TaxID=393278 RepID=UPI0008E27423|nr:hypothetical protein [Donghicola eburneus]SFQ78728.1 Membrane protein involved in the export of O-antigen and teichoic acid [Donghicola eburneus]
MVIITPKRVATSPIVVSLLVRGMAIALKSVQLIVLMRLYGSELYGVFSIALGVFGLTMVFAQFGLDHFVQREAASSDRKSYANLVRIGWFLALPGLAAALIAQSFVWHFYSRDVALVFTVLVVAAPIYAISWNHIFVLRGSGRVQFSLFLFEIVNPLVLILAAFLFRGEALGLAFSFLFASVITLILTTIYVSKPPTDVIEGTGWIGSPTKSVVEARSFYATSVLQAVQSLADGLVVGFFLRPFDAALYAIITRMSGLVLMPIAILSIYMKNLVARLRGQPLIEIWRQMRTFAFTSVSVSATLWIILIALLPFIGTIFDTKFPSEAKWTYLVVVTTRALQGSATSLNSALLMSGRERFITRIHMVLLPPYLYLLCVFAKSHGLLGVGLSLLGYAGANIAATICVFMANVKNQPTSELLQKADNLK